MIRIMVYGLPPIGSGKLDVCPTAFYYLLDGHALAGGD